MWTKINYLSQLVRDFLFKILSPPFCESCRKFIEQRSVLCLDCMQKITPVAVHDLILSATCKVPIYAIGAYQEPLKGLVLAKKRAYVLASYYLGEQIYAKTPFCNLPCDFLIPVPLHWTRILKRGYNQSLVMANRLQQLRPEILVVDVLNRHRATRYQTGLSKLERAQNLKNAFALKKIDLSLYRNKDLILIDDVFTSGATLAAATKALLKLEPKSIAIVVACRAI